MNLSRTRIALALLWLPLAAVATERPLAVASNGLADLSLEQLSEVQVTSVSGRPESLRGAAASVYVITAEDIRRSAATTLPEVLRLAPNLQVARMSAGQYAIGASGLNTAITNKLLVLVDGRTIYSTLFAGVFWDVQDLVLEDIERIEVISGPGGTLWGANAVNGVINVITRPAGTTQGAQVSATRSRKGGQESVRYGGRLGDVGHYRVYALGTDRADTRSGTGLVRPDSSSQRQLGFRADLTLDGGNLTVQGDAYRGGKDPANNLAPKVEGANLLARWDGRFAGGSPYRLQAYWDRAERDDVNLFRNESESVDVQFTHEPGLPAGQQLLWGGGWRAGRDENAPSVLVGFIPPERRLTWANVFAQHQLRLGAWQLTTGAKAERNSYTGLEFLPSVRLAYDHAGRATTWAAISRTVRAPARIDRELYLPARPPYLIAGGPDFQSEVARVAELGHRGQVGSDVSYSATLFRQSYEGLRGGEPRGTAQVVANRFEGHVDGLVAWGNWQPAPWTRLSLGYQGLRKRLHASTPPEDPTGIANLGNDPRHQWVLRTQFDLGRRVELDVHLRHVDALPAPAVPSYTSVDARLGWRVNPRLELSLLAQNLFDREHREFESPAQGSTFGRRLFLRAVWTP